MARPNSIISSPYRKEIEEFIKEGKPNTYISNWLREHDAYISTHTLGNYRNNEFNIQLEAQRKYNEKQSQKRKDDASDQVVNDIEIIDNILKEISAEIMNELDPRDQIKALPQLLNTKYKILGQISDSPVVNIDTNTNINFNTLNQNKILEEEGYDK
jgi:hypothetical protein